MFQALCWWRESLFPGAGCLSISQWLGPRNNGSWHLVSARGGGTSTFLQLPIFRICEALHQPDSDSFHCGSSRCFGSLRSAHGTCSSTSGFCPLGNHATTPLKVWGDDRDFERTQPRQFYTGAVWVVNRLVKLIAVNMCYMSYMYYIHIIHSGEHIIVPS